MQVQNDLIFWAWVLAKGQELFNMRAGQNQFISVKAAFATSESRDLPPPEGIGTQGEDAEGDDAWLEKELDLAVQEALDKPSDGDLNS
jgi:hypothetical protein